MKYSVGEEIISKMLAGSREITGTAKEKPSSTNFGEIEADDRCGKHRVDDLPEVLWYNIRMLSHDDGNFPVGEEMDDMNLI